MLNVGIRALALIACASLLSTNPAQARIWTCEATIFLVGTSHQYTPPNWTMKTGDSDTVWGDREKSCKTYIERRILKSDLWARFKLSASEMDRICKDSRGEFRVTYGFDKRPKAWSFTTALPAPACDCQGTCAAGYELGTTSPENPRCVRLICASAASGIPNERFGPHENGIGIWNGSVYHHQPVQGRICKFK